MKYITLALIALLVLTGAAPAQARGFHGGFAVEVTPYGYPYYYYPSYSYPYPYYYPYPYGTEVSPPVFGESLASNPYCREYTRHVVIDGRTQRAYGTACQQPDGTWRLMDERP